ncbi:SETMR methyltransferase, partial [Acromyrmex heyeri]
KNEFRTVIKHLHMVHSTSAPAFATVYNWVNEIKRGHTSTCDAPCSGRPEIIDKVHDIILTDRRVKVREFVEATGISHGTVISILHEQLDMKKLSTRWVSRLLIVDHKRDRVTISKQCLEMFQRNPDEFLRRFITVDETWIHYFTPETKGHDYYAALLDRFNNILYLAKKKVLFHQDNATGKRMANEFRYELLSHPAYSPNLAPCDYFLFPNLKKQRATHRNRGLF